MRPAASWRPRVARTTGSLTEAVYAARSSGAGLPGMAFSAVVAVILGSAAVLLKARVH